MTRVLVTGVKGFLGKRLVCSLRESWRKSTIGRSARVLSRRDQRRILAVIIIQVIMGIMDLLGVAIIGILGALTISGVQSQQPGNRVNSVLEILGIGNNTFQSQIAILGILAASIFIGRTIFSIVFTRRTLFFLSRRGAAISADLISRLLSQPLLKIQSRTSQETLYAVTVGVTTITLGILATTVTLISDLSLLVIMAIGLFVVDPFIALGTFLLFSAIGFLLYRLMQVKAHEMGRKESELSIRSNEKIIEVLNSYRESVVRNRRDFYAREIGKLRFELADTLAEFAFMPNISKYVIETTVILGALIICAIQFTMQDATHAVAILSVFLAAGTRIAPAILRMQQGSITIRSALGNAGPTLDLIESLGENRTESKEVNFVEVVHEGFIPNVEISNVSLTYPSGTHKALSNIYLEFEHGKFYAILGPSGAGKTSIVDVLLGVLDPDEGEILISNLPPLTAVAKWPGAVSYVPQDVMISNGTIRQNVALGFPEEVASDTLVNQAIGISQLTDFVASLPNGLDTQVGERGTKISGGQRQRLGIARAMFTNPKLLVLDEATSSLDGQTESDISDAIQNLKGSVTVVMIAHRLSTVRNVDVVIYMDQGKILAKGTFEEVRNSIPDFDNQARLMGL
jgi:ABC-type multidrug transport system fused ATPase/permease subunit